MSVVMDIVFSTLVFGILAFSVGHVQININTATSQNYYNIIVQTNSVELARLVEYDFSKIGYHAAGQKSRLPIPRQVQMSGDRTLKESRRKK